jgi:hypothetical protein
VRAAAFAPPKRLALYHGAVKPAVSAEGQVWWVVFFWSGCCSCARVFAMC